MAQSPNSRLKRVAVAGLTVAGASALSLAAVIPAGAAVVSQNANNIIVGSGSSTTYNMMQQIDLLFNNAQSCPMTTANSAVTAAPLDFGCIAGGGGDPLALNASPTTTPENPWADVAVEEPAIGSSSGIAQLSKASGAHTTSVNDATNVNFARSTRVAASSDYTGLNFVAYAEDAVSWFHFTSVPGADQTTTETNGANARTVSTPNGTSIPTPSAGITNLTKAQIAGIYAGTYTNWNQVGGSNAPIVVFAPQEGSGTQSTFKTYLGADPSATSNHVNCVGAGTSGCTGPVVIFENELSSLNSSTFIGNQVTNFLPTIPAVAGTANDTVIDNRTATTEGNAAKNATKITVASNAGLAVGAVLTIPGSAGTFTVTAINPVTKSGHITGYQVVIGSKLAAAVPAASTISWTNTTHTSNRNFTVANADEAVRADAIFFYSYGKWNAQTHATLTGTGAGASLNTANCATQDCGSANLPAGYSATLGNLDSTPLNNYNTIAELFPASRYLFNVYSNGSNSKIPAATAPTLNYVSEAGFICKPQNASLVDASTGHSYLSEIQSAIEAQGFFPISAGASSGVVNQTPGDEGSVTNPVTGMTLTATGSQETGTGAQTATTNNYGLYMNVPGTGLAGGQQTVSNGDLSGFCLVSSTDGNASS